MKTKSKVGKLTPSDEALTKAFTKGVKEAIQATRKAGYPVYAMANGKLVIVPQNEDLVYRLRKRAEIRRQISTRKSVQEGKPDRISDLLEEAASEIERFKELIKIPS
jgi:hypothetical protein